MPPHSSLAAQPQRESLWKEANLGESQGHSGRPSCGEQRELWRSLNHAAGSGLQTQWVVLLGYEKAVCGLA